MFLISGVEEIFDTIKSKFNKKRNNPADSTPAITQTACDESINSQDSTPAITQTACDESINSQDSTPAITQTARDEFINSQDFISSLSLSQSFDIEVTNFRQGYFRHSYKDYIVKKYESLYKTVSSTIYKKHKITQFIPFCTTYLNISSLVDEWNRDYVVNEVRNNEVFFDDIDGRKLDEQQRRAVVVDEDNNLVLAGAGSGKTLTVSAKVKYLVEKKNVNPKDILLITFTKKASAEMQERISDRLNIAVEANTFHKFGFDVLKNVLGFRPDVFDELPSFVNQYFKNDILKDPKAMKNAIEFFGLYIHMPSKYNNIESLGQVIEREKKLDLETIKSMIETEEAEFSKNKETFQGEIVRSVEEAVIANHLYLNGINYEYERLYPFEAADTFRKRYRPDFYLPDYDIYLEHFGIDENNQVPWLSPIEEKKYLQGIVWKREFHKTNGTKLIETYSYYNNKGRLLIELNKLLHNCRVKFKKVDYPSTYNRLFIEKKNRTFLESQKLICTFINLFKSMGYVEESFQLLESKSSKLLDIFMKNREKLFLAIVKPVFIRYQKMLHEKGYIDFNDMINLATKSIKEGAVRFPYKYIIVDEFQDISVSRFNLIKALKDQTNAVILAVGDDWQSIYRFAGSDVELFTRFSDYFGYSETLKIEKTYRNSQELIDIASKFILKNPKQLKKQLLSDKKQHDPLKILIFKNDICEAVNIALDEIVRHYGVNSTVLMLGRNNFDKEAMNASEDFLIITESQRVKIICKRYPSLTIEFMTVHKSKGLEAENVIVINAENKLTGFPNKIADDPILSLVLTDSDKYEYAEERRLLYVAMTRTKNMTFLLASDGGKSIFIDELLHDNKSLYYEKATIEDIISDNPKCPFCKTGTLIIRENKEGKKFLGCSNFPGCTNSYNDINILNDVVLCKKCGGYMVKRSGKSGQFYACTNYPTCKSTIEISHQIEKVFANKVESKQISNSQMEVRSNNLESKNEATVIAGDVFTRMPDELLKNYAEQGVLGAQKELQNRSVGLQRSPTQPMHQESSKLSQKAIKRKIRVPKDTPKYDIPKESRPNKALKTH
jgi:DNA helicase-4